MFLKVSVSFLLLVCFVNFNHASVDTYTEYDHYTTKGSGKSFRDFTYEIEKSFKELTKNSEWIYHLVSILKTGLEKGFETITTWPVDLALRVELFVMADGSHFAFPLGEKYGKEKEYKAVAIAVSNLYMNLKTMERVDEVMKNATKRLLSEEYGHRYEDYQTNPQKFFVTFLQNYFKIVGHQMETDDVLRGEYRKTLNEARETVERDPKMRGPLDEVWGKYGDTKYSDVEEVKSFFQDKETFHRAIASKIFMKQSINYFSMTFRPEQHKRYLLARALIQKSFVSTYTESKINSVYHQALVKAGEVGVNGDFNSIREKLFTYLQGTLESDTTLYDEIKVVMKQIEKTSAYDSDMYIDFSIL